MALEHQSEESFTVIGHDVKSIPHYHHLIRVMEKKMSFKVTESAITILSSVLIRMCKYLH